MASGSGADAELRERVAALEQTVAEQQHHSSESPKQPTASRRGFVKAAAAVAGLGALGIYSSYPARAQAAGQVGTASEPVDVEAYDLNVQGSVSGIDTGGVENPMTADLDAGGNSLTNVAAQNGTIWIDATASDAQNQIENLSTNETGIVYGGTYDPGTETEIPLRSTLKFRKDAWWQPTSDYPGFFVDNGVVANINAVTSNATLSNSSHVVSLDGTRSTGSYVETQLNKGVDIRLNAQGNIGEGVALRFKTGDVSQGENPISIGNRLNINSWGYQNAIRVEGSSYANVDQIFLTSNRAKKHIVQDSSQFATEIMGALQPNTNSSTTEQAIVNNTTEPSLRFRGLLWDVDDYTQQPIDGADIQASVRSDSTVRKLDGTGVAGNGTVVKSNYDGGWVRWLGAHDRVDELFVDQFGNWKREVGGNRVVGYRSDRTDFEEDIFFIKKSGIFRFKDNNFDSHELTAENDGLKYIEPDGTKHDLSTV
jgi:hypothetical protein